MPGTMARPALVAAGHRGVHPTPGGRSQDALAAGKVTGTNREVEAAVADSLAARTAASSFSK